MKETKFKDTEIGRIPEEWSCVKIGEVCQVNRGVRVTRNQLSNEGVFPVYQNTNYPMGFYNRYNVEAGTPFVIIGESAGLVGYSNRRYWAADDCAYFSMCNNLNLGFLYNELIHRQSEIMLNVKTASVPRLDRKVLQDLMIPLPDVIEQSRIAKALSTIDNLISELDKLIEKKRAIKQGAMQQLLTGKKRLKGFNEPWVEKKLGEIGTLAMCKRIFLEDTKENGDVPFYKIGTFGQQANAYISYAKFAEFKKAYRFPHKGDILISAGTIGRTVIYDGKPAYFQDSNIVWLAHDETHIVNTYLYYVYQIVEWDTENTTIARLYNNNFNNTSIMFPISLVEQHAIATILKSIDKELVTLEAKKVKFENIKQGMMQ